MASAELAVVASTIAITVVGNPPQRYCNREVHAASVFCSGGWLFKVPRPRKVVEGARGGFVMY